MTNKAKHPRISKDQYYLNIAQECTLRGTCLRRNYGAVIVKDDQIISTGYTGSPRGRTNCTDHGLCLREQLNIPSGERYEICRSVHAETNACIHASRKDMIGATMYVCGVFYETKKIFRDTIPCEFCKRIIINSGISRVVIRRTLEEYEEYDVSCWVNEEPNFRS